MASRSGRAAVGGAAAGAGALWGVLGLRRKDLLCRGPQRCAGPRSVLLCWLSVGVLLGGIHLYQHILSPVYITAAVWSNSYWSPEHISLSSPGPSDSYCHSQFTGVFSLLVMIEPNNEWSLVLLTDVALGGPSTKTFMLLALGSP